MLHNLIKYIYIFNKDNIIIKTSKKIFYDIFKHMNPAKLRISKQIIK